MSNEDKNMSVVNSAKHVFLTIIKANDCLNKKINHMSDVIKD